MQVSCVASQYVSETTGCVARSVAFGDSGEVAIHPVRALPSHSQIGCRMRVRGVPSALVVATVHQTMRWAIATKAGATEARSVMAAG